MWSHVHLEYVGEAVGRVDAHHPPVVAGNPTEQVVDANASIASAALVNGLAGHTELFLVPKVHPSFVSHLDGGGDVVEELRSCQDDTILRLP